MLVNSGSKILNTAIKYIFMRGGTNLLQDEIGS